MDNVVVNAEPNAELVDVAIVGGGLVGASLALALAPTGLRTALIEGVAPDATAQPSFDDRTTALGNGTRRTFEALGLWSQIATQAAAIRRIHVSDAGRFGFARLDAAEHGIEAFGYVVTNRVLGAALQSRLRGLPDLRWRMPARCTAVSIGEQTGELQTEPESLPLRARLVIAADGANSRVREAAGLGADIEDYAQVALVAHVRATRAADGTAFERFTPSGPFAVLPLHDGAYGVVWTLAPAEAERVLQYTDAEYLAALQQAFGWRIGRLQTVGRRTAYPLRLSRAQTLVGRRVALIGNAAQGLHPVAGQGFNLGLRDAATLAELLAEVVSRQGAGADIGAPSVLEEFASRRHADRDGVTRFTDGLVKLFGDQRAGVPLLRDLGLLLFDLSPTAKQAMSRLSWGFAGRTPRLGRGLGVIP
ncbi:MAG: 2-octaprenyl-6-methoxyphenyl hydroxylase [Gammaproteobacteria bacterium]|nr:2-octaprenyl-6-methoxyphenyl hydroxylase [Gammaproteobacteria bacterium]